MSKDEKVSLKSIQKESGDLKKTVTNLLKLCKKQQESKKPDAKEKLLDLYHQCVANLDQIVLLQEKIDSLSQTDEPKIKDLEKKKVAETKKVTALKDQLDQMITKIKPEDEDLEEDVSEGDEQSGDETGDEDDGSEYYSDDETKTEEAPAQKAATKSVDKSVDDGASDDENDDEDGDEEGDESDSAAVVKKPAEKPPKLDLQQDEGSDADDDDDSNVDDSEASGDEAVKFGDDDDLELPRRFITLKDWEGEHEDDLPFKKDDILTVVQIMEQGWRLATNDAGERGVVPGNFLRLISDDEASEDETEHAKGALQDTDKLELEEDTLGTSKGKGMWKKLRSSMRETPVSDALHAFGAVPTGYRDSTLRKMLDEGDKYTMVNLLAPKLSASNISFRDISFNAQNLKPPAASAGSTSRFQKVFQLTRCQNIPPPGKEASEDMEVKSRHARICLFNGEKVLSNILSIKCTSVDKSEQNWTFNTKLNDQTKGAEFAEFFCRTKIAHENLGVLVELAMTFVRKKSGQEYEMSCGWTHFRFYDENGTVTPNKNFDLFANGGTPYEQGVDIDPAIGRKTMTTNLRNLMATGKQPKITLKVMEPNKAYKEHLDSLPDVLIGSTAYLPYFAFYRQTLSDALLKDKYDMQSTELIHHPFLVAFPQVADQPDIMDAVKSVYKESMKNIRQADKREPQSLRELYVKTFNALGYPLLHAPALPPHKFGCKENESSRQDEIVKWLKYNKDTRPSPGALLCAEIEHEPFDISELSFDIIGPNCLEKAVR